MIDSNTLNQLGATLRHQSAIDRAYGENMAAGPWAALRLGMRMDADQKRREVDFVNAHKDAVLMEQNKGALAQARGKELLDEERRAAFDADTSVDRSPIKKKAQEYYTEAPDLETLKRLNPELASTFTPGAWEAVKNKWGQGQGQDYAYSMATGKIYKKPTAGTMLSDKELEEFIEEQDKANEDLKRWREYEEEKDPEKLYADWYAKNYGNESAEDREKKMKELFDKDYAEKFSSLFANKEDEERFRELSQDPRLTVFDPQLGARVLKRPDELYYDLGNYDQYMAPEMAPPYFQRASDLLGLYKDQWTKQLGELDKQTMNYEQLAQNSRNEQNKMQELIAQGWVNWQNASLEGNAPLAAEYERGIENFRQRLEELKQDEEYNREMARRTLDARDELRQKGALAFVSSPFAGRKFFGRIYSPTVLNELGLPEDTEGRNRPRGPSARGNEEAVMPQAAADAARQAYQYSGLDATDQYAEMNKGLMPVTSLAPGARTALGAAEYKWDRAKFRMGQEGIAPNQPYSIAKIQNVFSLTNPSSYYNFLLQLNSDLKAGSDTENLRLGLFNAGLVDGKTRSVDDKTVAGISTRQMVDYLYNAAQNNPETAAKNRTQSKWQKYVLAAQNYAYKKSYKTDTDADKAYLDKCKAEWMAVAPKPNGGK